MQRLLTAIALILVGLYLIYLAPNSVFRGAAILTGFLCYREYSDLVVSHGVRRPNAMGFLLGLVILYKPAFVLPALAAVTMASFVSSLQLPNLAEVLPQVAGTILGGVAMFIPWRFATDLRLISVHLLFFALASNWVGDSAAYYVGRSFGRHRLAPSISPNKSWEGGIASVLAVTTFGVLYLQYFVPSLRLWFIIVLSVVGNVMGQLGDLSESAIKRGAGVKDSGHLLPGHGGILDRMDSSLFSLPTIYCLYVVRQIVH